MRSPFSYWLGTALVVLGRTGDRRDPALAALHPDLGPWRQPERCIVEASEPDLDDAVVQVGEVDQPRSAARAEAAIVEARDLTRQPERVDRPVRVDGERAAGFLAAVCAVAASDANRLTANGVA